MHGVHEEPARDHVPELAPLAGVATLYLPVTDILEIETKLAGHEPVLMRRDTFYGMREIIVREPSGHFVFFGQRIAVDAP